MSVLVDRSVWIEGSKANGKAKAKLSQLIRSADETICISSPIQTEVCQGARTQLEFQKVWDAFLGFHFLPVNDGHWELSAWNYFRCRKSGITISTMDCLIATIARSKLFKLAQPIIGFDLYQPVR